MESLSAVITARTDEIDQALANIKPVPITKAVSIILPVWNRADLTMQFLKKHWELYRDRPDVEIVAVDNGSEDTTPGVLAQWNQTLGDRMKTVRNEFNFGFSAGHNTGAAFARGGILVFMSNDVIASGDYIAAIEDRLSDEPDVLLGAEILSHDTGWNSFYGVRGSDDQVMSEKTPIPYLGGWCIAAYRPLWDSLGGWDERYFPSDYEDVDLSYTAIQAGVKLVAISLPLRHLFGQTAQQIQGGREQITYKNRALFMAKWGLSE